MYLRMKGRSSACASPKAGSWTTAAVDAMSDPLPLEERCRRGCGRRTAALVEPALIVGLGMHGGDRAHAIMSEPAQLRAGELERSRVGRLEPHTDGHPRNRILLDAERGDEEGVDRIFGRQGCDDRLVHLEMQLIANFQIIA